MCLAQGTAVTELARDGLAKVCLVGPVEESRATARKADVSLNAVELLDSGSHVLASDDLYGGTFRLFERVRRRSAGLDFSFVNLNDLDALEAVVKPNTRMIWCETPTNPLLKIVDIAAVARLAKAKGAIVVVDNTFATPVLQNPLTLGADSGVPLLSPPDKE